MPDSNAASTWLILPLASILCVGVIVVRLGAIALQGEPLRRRVLGGALLTTALIVLVVRMLGALGQVSQAILFGTLVSTCAALLFFRREVRLGASWRGLASIDTAPLGLVACGAVVVCAVAAYLLPVWQWDSLGYHLPFVDFVLQTRSLSKVPDDMPYVSTYPHVVELVFVAWRAVLPDDRLVDAAQIPFGIFGALAIAAVARELGARRALAVCAGLAWLTLPAVFLQLPTNYVDVATAAFLVTAVAFLLAPTSARNIVLAGVAIGLFLGSKPNAPIGTTLLFGALVLSAWRSGHRSALVIAAGCVLAFGAESYVTNFVRHGNPIWPVDAHFGPIHLRGTTPMTHLLESGAAAPHLVGWGPLRVLRSWTTLNSLPAFDMRYGGLGVLFLAALPVALVALVRRRSIPLVLSMLAALASPDPAVARYVLAFPALVFALAAPALDQVALRTRSAVLWTAALAAVFTLVQAYPGLAGEGPPLRAYFGMSPDERARAVGADGPPGAYLDAHQRLERGASVAFDETLPLPYLAWPSDLSHSAIWLGSEPDHADVDKLVADPSVRMLIVGDLSRAAFVAQPYFNALFHCKSATCTVYLRR